MTAMVRLAQREDLLSRTAYARQGVRALLDQLGPVRFVPGPGPGALLASVLGVLVVPCAILCDYWLFAAPVEFIASLAAGPRMNVRLLVPVALAIVDVIVSLQRALQDFDPYAERRRLRWVPIMGAVFGIQVSAAVAQYLALQAVAPSPTNAVLLGFLALLALVTHAAALLWSGESALLLVTEAAEKGRRARHAKLTRRLRRHSHDLLRHYRAWKDLCHEHERTNSDEPARELDPAIIAELEDAIGTKNPPARTPAGPPSAGPGVDQPPNPYAQDPSWGDDQRL